jgi:SAM-dependent methyltransferase
MLDQSMPTPPEKKRFSPEGLFPQKDPSMVRVSHRGGKLPSHALSTEAPNAGFPGYHLKAPERPQGLTKTIRHVSDEVACAYNQAGSDYAFYADGDSSDLFIFTGLHAHADRIVWARMDAALRELRELGTTSLSVLDIGCGPGTWLRRLVLRAHELGFSVIRARGFDIAEEQIGLARLLSRDLVQLPGVKISFDTADLNRSFPEADNSIDITLCLYSVLSHIQTEKINAVAAEIARVTRGSFITTVRPLGSMPTIFVDSIEKSSWFQHHAQSDRFEVALTDGLYFTFNVHLFNATELAALFSKYFTIKEMSGLDIFIGRFAPDPRWNPACFEMKDMLIEHLARLEEIFSNDPAFLEYATHLLLIGTKKDDSQPGLSPETFNV